jgi:hypothetical protein
MTVEKTQLVESNRQIDDAPETFTMPLLLVQSIFLDLAGNSFLPHEAPSAIRLRQVHSCRGCGGGAINPSIESHMNTGKHITQLVAL